MEPSPAPHEGPAKAAESVEPGSLSRFKTLARRLLAVDPSVFQEARTVDEEERRDRRNAGKQV
jgi:hypothetical protein